MHASRDISIFFNLSPIRVLDCVKITPLQRSAHKTRTFSVTLQSTVTDYTYV